MNVQKTVRERYSEGAKEVQAALCCPVDYDADLLKMLPSEIVEKDYGCGDPSRYVREGDVVLDLGSGSGKICYMAAQLVGKRGQVIGVDMNDDMLALARKYAPMMADKLGGQRVRFVKVIFKIWLSTWRRWKNICANIRSAQPTSSKCCSIGNNNNAWKLH